MGVDKEDLYRRLAKTRRFIKDAIDPLTRERLQALAVELEQQLAAAEAQDADAPPE